MPRLFFLPWIGEVRRGRERLLRNKKFCRSTPSRSPYPGGEYNLSVVDLSYFIYNLLEMQNTNTADRSWLLARLDQALLTPIRALRKRYIPLLTIYFAYGLSGFSAIALSFWQKENLGLSAEELISISVWVMVPWTLKMVFGQMVDSVSIFGSRRKIYVYIGALFMVLGATLLAGMAGQHDWAMSIGTEYQVYLLSALFTTLGFVMQDVTADTMTTEVVERIEMVNGQELARSEADIQADLSMVQVLGRLALSLAAFSVAGLGGYLAQNFSYESIFWATLVLPLISCV